VIYEGYEGAKPDAPNESLAGLDLWQYGLGRGQDVLPRPSGRERVYDLALSGGMMGSDVWTINGKQYPQTDPLRLGRGDVARVRFVNHSMEAHPMHLHGQSFKVVAVNGARYAQPIVKDSVDVDPHMGSVVLQFTAHNPGDWFFHCHKPMHMDGGMITLARIA
jgi:FtsP/CotA-like multicopper oxidase with cupredoxin domain